MHSSMQTNGIFLTGALMAGATQCLTAVQRSAGSVATSHIDSPGEQRASVADAARDAR
jgi:hypothetical protein